VFEETHEAALHSLVIDILEAYKDRGHGVNQSVAHMRKAIPEWMTWPMLNEWAQRFIANLDAQRTCTAIQDKEDRDDISTRNHKLIG